jgi:hypothetical protein
MDRYNVCVWGLLLPALMWVALSESATCSGVYHGASPFLRLEIYARALPHNPGGLD